LSAVHSYDVQNGTTSCFITETPARVDQPNLEWTGEEIAVFRNNSWKGGGSLECADGRVFRVMLHRDAATA